MLIKSSQASLYMASTVEIKDLLFNYYGDSQSDFASNLVSELEKADKKECPVFIFELILGMLWRLC